MGKDNLFIEPEFKKTAVNKDNWLQMPYEKSLWEEEILSAFYSEHPEFTEFPAEVNMKEDKKSKGQNATGSLTLTKSLRLPIIIKDYKLAPFDTAIVLGEEIVPFDNNIKTLFLKNKTKVLTKDQFKDYVKPTKNVDLTTAPTMLTKIAYITEDQKNDFINQIKTDPGGAFLLESAGVLDKVAKFTTEVTIEKSLNNDKFGQLYKTAEDTYAYRGVSDYGTTNIDNISKEEMAKLAEHMDPELKCYTDAPKTFQPEEYIAKQYNVVQNDLQKTANVKFFIFGDKSYTFDMEKVGKVSNHLNFYSTRPEVGHKGAFVLKEEDSTITDPMNITKIAQLEHCTVIKGNTLGGHSVGFVLTKGLNKIAKVTADDIDAYGLQGYDSVYIPYKTKFVKLDKEIAQPTENIMKSANVIRKYNGKYSLEGSEIDKLASSARTRFLDKEDAVWAMLNLGIGTDIIKLALDINDGGELGLPLAQTFENSVTSEVDDDYSYNLKLNSRDLFKVASMAAEKEDPKVSENVMSMGFINKKNIREYAKNIELFETTRQRLAELLLKIRLEDSPVEEDSLLNTIEGITYVINELRIITKKGN